MENNKKTNILAIVGFILSFFISIPGLICSILGLVKLKEYNNGKGLSIAGIIISVLRFILIIAVFILGILSVVDEIKNDSSSYIVGNWEPYKLEINGKDRPLIDYYGSCIKYGGFITFYKNNIYENKVGCYSESDNKYNYIIEGKNIYLTDDLNKKTNYFILSDNNDSITYIIDEYKIYFKKTNNSI